MLFLTHAVDGHNSLLLTYSILKVMWAISRNSWVCLLADRSPQAYARINCSKLCRSTMSQGSKLSASPCSAIFMTNFPPCVRQVPCTVLHLPRMVSLRCQTVFPLSGRSSSESRYQSKLLMHQLSCCWRSMEEASQRYMPS